MHFSLTFAPSWSAVTCCSPLPQKGAWERRGEGALGRCSWASLTCLIMICTWFFRLLPILGRHVDMNRLSSGTFCMWFCSCSFQSEVHQLRCIFLLAFSFSSFHCEEYCGYLWYYNVSVLHFSLWVQMLPMAVAIDWWQRILKLLFTDLGLREVRSPSFGELR